eukprot:SAG22_NODE_7926_length_697_cov_0.949833_1_plen_193_part_10
MGSCRRFWEASSLSFNNTRQKHTHASTPLHNNKVVGGPRARRTTAAITATITIVIHKVTAGHTHQMSSDPSTDINVGRRPNTGLTCGEPDNFAAPWHGDGGPPPAAAGPPPGLAGAPGMLLAPTSPFPPAAPGTCWLPSNRSANDRHMPGGRSGLSCRQVSYTCHGAAVPTESCRLRGSEEHRRSEPPVLGAA